MPSGTKPATRESGNVNTYAAIEGGWMGDVYNQALSGKVTGGAQNEYWPGNSTSQQLENQLIAALGSSTTAVTIGTDNFNYSSSTGLYGDHAYVGAQLHQPGTRRGHLPAL